MMPHKGFARLITIFRRERLAAPLRLALLLLERHHIGGDALGVGCGAEDLPADLPRLA